MIFIKIPFRGSLYFEKKSLISKSLNYDDSEFWKVNITIISAQFTIKFDKNNLIVRSKSEKHLNYKFWMFWQFLEIFIWMSKFGAWNKLPCKFSRIYNSDKTNKFTTFCTLYKTSLVIWPIID